MSIIEETRALRRELAALAAEPEWGLLARYDLLGKKPPQSLQDRVSRLARRLLTVSGLAPPHVTKYPWVPTLKHATVVADAKALLIWAPGMGRNELRQACEGFSKRLKGNSSLAPVLVTDVADFTYYSRLGWLVEYLPELSGEGKSYQERKLRHLAWRYRDALIVPMTAGLASEAEWNALLEVSCK